MNISAPIRRNTRQARVGHVLVGGGAPIVEQSMTNTDTADVVATVRQVMELAQAGSELVRGTVNNIESAQAGPLIREKRDGAGGKGPWTGEFHFNAHKLLAQVPECAEALDKLPINPGNVGRGQKRDKQFPTLIDIACRYG